MGLKGGKGKQGKGQNKGYQTDEYTSMTFLSMSYEGKQPETESPDQETTSEEWQVPTKRVKSTRGQLYSSCATTNLRPSRSTNTKRRQERTEGK